MNTPPPDPQKIKPSVGDLVEWVDPVNGGSGVFGIVVNVAQAEYSALPRRYIEVTWLNSPLLSVLYGKFVLDYNVKVLNQFSIREKTA